MEVRGGSALVTGGASGLGAAAATRLATAGVFVVIADIQDVPGEALAAELGGAFVRVDVTNATELAGAVEVATESAPLRVLVNCAGIAPPQRTVDRDGAPHDLARWEAVVAINLTGSFNAIRLVATAMAESEPLEDNECGAIVNTASVAAFDGQVGQAAYSASKGGIVGMTLPIARDLAPLGIRVNTIAPGIMDTPLLAGLPQPARESLGHQVLHPQRLGTPEEFADLAYFLITHSYMNAAVVRMDGGIRMAPK